MANSDQAVNLLRYNLVSTVLEYFAGSLWTPLQLRPIQTSITSTVSNNTTSTSFVATVLSLSYTAASIGRNLKFTVSGVGFLATGGNTAQYTILKDGVNIVTTGLQEYTAAAGGTIFPVHFTYMTPAIDNAAHTYAVALKSTGGSSVQFGTGDITTNSFIIEEF